MSSEMDRALLALSLKDDDDGLFTLPNLPQYFATERNACSLIGRLLNPEFQRLPKLILDLPRRWQKAERVRGFAQTKEKFQFVFMHEHDLQEVLDKEKPPPGYLQSVSIWVRISNIPVNHYTKETISELGDLIGHVEKVIFDPRKTTEARVLNLPGGEQTTICYYYEKVQKRCYHCQRLTHAKERCPFLEHDKGSRDQSTGFMTISQTPRPQRVLEVNDPLFGVLKEDQVGINPLSGRPRIAPEILQEMCNYLLASSSKDRHVREQRVIASVKDAEMNPATQRSVMQLISTQLFTSDINKGKGIVFLYDKEERMGHYFIPNPQPKLMASAISSGQTLFNTTSLQLMFSVNCRYHPFNSLRRIKSVL
ncbi:PREDICTED: uncharacterized protein LOC106302345 [Brassica oleracea var. oleracea]|uniref:uncharacterized protein LOC106302345 n=1 Tax=Brassica oleracea var. oleracea TaxID=109376 RepID=UPI0006A734CE|nr:PREDICTED: uncharacterized protein LOC106302345 [Brassica oleracea var. oleracea]